MVILREDRGVPLGHVAPVDDGSGSGGGGGGLCEQAGLSLLMKVARVRLLSAGEGAVTSPR